MSVHRSGLAGLAILLVAALGAPVAAAESPAPSASAEAAVGTATEVTIDCDTFQATPAAVQTVDVAAGSSIVVSLCSNPTTGYRWSDPVSTDPAVASIGAWAFETPTAAAPGAPGSEHFTIEALAAGSAVVTSSYDQPWDGGTKGSWTLELTVNVQ